MKTPLTISLEMEDAEALKHWAKERGRSVSDVVREGIHAVLLPTDLFAQTSPAKSASRGKRKDAEQTPEQGRPVHAAVESSGAPNSGDNLPVSAEPLTEQSESAYVRQLRREREGCVEQASGHSTVAPSTRSEVAPPVPDSSPASRFPDTSEYKALKDKVYVCTTSEKVLCELITAHVGCTPVDLFRALEECKRDGLAVRWEETEEGWVCWDETVR